MTYKTTLQELLHAINIVNGDCNVYVVGNDNIAVCPPIKITPEGREYFRKALNATVEAVYAGFHQDTYVSDDDEVNQDAWRLLTSLAGNCPEPKFQKWFEGETAELI